MANPKIITKPIHYGDQISKSRNVTGMGRGGSSRFLGAIMLVLEWFTVPMEVFFRRDFGQRWFTPVNFIAGLVLMALVFFLELFILQLPASTHEYFANMGRYDPFNTTAEFLGKDSDEIEIQFVLCALYVLMGLYQLFKIKWRNYANMPLHSFDDGTSRLRWPAFLLMWVFNILAIPFVMLYWLLIPLKQRRGKWFPVLVKEKDYFANVFVEPALVFYLSWGFGGITGIWLLVSGVAMLIHTNRKEMARRHKILDFQDSKIESRIMRELKEALAKKEANTKTEEPTTATLKNQPVEPKVIITYSNLATIIEELHQKRQPRNANT